MSNLMMIADRVLNRPLLITRDKAQMILSVLGSRIGVDAPDASRFEGDRFERDQSGRPVAVKPYSVSDGVGIITVVGTLVNRGAWIGSYSGLTSYEGIGHQLKTAASDPAVTSVILDLHSPGGEAVGAFEIAALVRQLSATKRTVAVVNGMAASAAYAIASGANEIVTTETGVSGSIGVVLLHADFSRQLDREGISPTLIHAGAHKVDGNPFEPLSLEVREDLQAEVNAFYDAFLSTVAKGRGKSLTAAAARKTEARTFIGQAAVTAGMADRLGTFDSVLAELHRAGGRKTVQPRRTSMDTNDQATPAAGSETYSSTRMAAEADHDRAVSAARGAGATAERDRFKAVTSSEHYAGREKSAMTMLTTTDMSAEAINSVLAGLPAAPAPAATAPAQTLPAERSQNAEGGLVIDATAGKQDQPAANDFEKGKQIAKGFKKA